MALFTQEPTEFNGIALCAGVGGLELGLHIAESGYRTVCYVEREVFPAAVLVARMAEKALDNAPIWDDVKTFDGRAWRGKVHLLTAGYPCQPFSFSGQRKGEADPRHLWPDIARVIGEVRPEWAFCENVEGHLTLGFAEVARDLQAMDYTVKAGLFSVLETGATHLRRRLYILAHANEVALCQPERNGAVEPGHEVSRRSNAGWFANLFGQDRPAMDPVVVDDAGMWRPADEEFSVGLYPPAPYQFAAWASALDRRPDLQPEFFGLDDGVANRMDRSDCAGNGVVPLAAALAWRTLKGQYMSECDYLEKPLKGA